MHRPVGRCLRKTQLDVLFIFCPPAPEPRTNFSNKCAAVIPSASIRNSNAAIFSEVIGLGTIKIKLESVKLTRPENLSGFEQRLDSDFFEDQLEISVNSLKIFLTKLDLIDE